MGLFKSNDERRIEREMKVKAGMRSLGRLIRQQEKFSEDFIKSARHAKQIGDVLQYQRLPPTFTLFPYTTLFRSAALGSPRTVQIGWSEEPRLTIQSDRKSTRLNSSHGYISYAVFCLKKKAV